MRPHGTRPAGEARGEQLSPPGDRCAREPVDPLVQLPPPSLLEAPGALALREAQVDDEVVGEDAVVSLRDVGESGVERMVHAETRPARVSA